MRNHTGLCSRSERPALTPPEIDADSGIQTLVIKIMPVPKAATRNAQCCARSSDRQQGGGPT